MDKGEIFTLMTGVLWGPWDLAHLVSQRKHQGGGKKGVVKEKVGGKGEGHGLIIHLGVLLGP